MKYYSDKELAKMDKRISTLEIIVGVLIPFIVILTIDFILNLK